MGVLYLVGRRPGVGVTAVGAGLAGLLRQSGRRVAALKPLARSADDADTAFLAAIAGNTAVPSRLVTLREGMTSGLADTIAAEVERLGATADVVIVEGLLIAGEDDAPLAASTALAARIGAKVVGVGLAADASEGVWGEAFGAAFAGLIVNRLSRYAAPPESPFPILGVVRDDRLLVAPSVGETVEHIGGTYFNGPFEDDALIEHFLIGGFIAEWGGNYFGRLSNQAVLARGGRLDLQLAALNFDVNCLILTACETPPQYTYLRAEERGVPLVTVRTGTVETAQALETVLSRSRVHHEAKARRAAALLAETVRWDAMHAAVGLSSSFSRYLSADFADPHR